jgi:hypothetical protein
MLSSSKVAAVLTNQYLCCLKQSTPHDTQVDQPQKQAWRYKANVQPTPTVLYTCWHRMFQRPPLNAPRAYWLVHPCSPVQT